MFAEVNEQTVVTFPYDYDTLVKHNPNTKFSAEDLVTMYAGTESNLAGNQLVRVVVADVPQYDEATQIAVQDGKPTLSGNTWALGWTVQSLSQSEKDARLVAKAKSVREERNRKLSETDWTQVADAPVDQAAWATYRTELRNLPSQADFPWDVTWPAQPE